MQAIGSSRAAWRAWLPAQHGAWVLLSVAAALGFIGAGGLSAAGLLCAGVIGFGFVTTHVVASGHWRAIPAPLRWGGVLLFVSGGVALVVVAPAAIVPGVIACGAGLASTTALLRGGPTDGQAAVAGGLASGAAAATVAAAGGAPMTVIAWIAALVGLFALARLSAVRAIFAHWGSAGAPIAAALLPILVVSALAWWRGMGWWGPIAFVPAALLGLWLTAADCRPTSRKCGLTEFAGAMAFLLLAGVDVVP